MVTPELSASIPISFPETLKGGGHTRPKEMSALGPSWGDRRFFQGSREMGFPPPSCSSANGGGTHTSPAEGDKRVRRGNLGLPRGSLSWAGASLVRPSGGPDTQREVWPHWPRSPGKAIQTGSPGSVGGHTRPLRGAARQVHSHGAPSTLLGFAPGGPPPGTLRPHPPNSAASFPNMPLLGLIYCLG